MIIAVMGEMCAGKSTVAKLLAAHYNIPHYSMGAIRRKMALERSMTLEEFNKLGETIDTDTMVEEYQRNLGETSDDFVADGRMSKYSIPHAIGVYLHADEGGRAQRLLADEEHHCQADPVTTLKEAVHLLRERERSDRKRYVRHYGVDPFDPSRYDIVIDTTTIPPEEVVAKIVEAIERLKMPDKK